MTIAEITGMITAAGVFLSSVISGLAYWQSRKNSQGIQAVHLATNSMKDALVLSTSIESYARGVKAGESSSMNINHRKPE